MACLKVVYSYGICSFRVKANSVFYVQCGKLIHGRCAGVEKVTAKHSRNFASRKCEGNVGGSEAERKVM